MPAGDGTGPLGFGAMTGRAAGYCAGYPVPGYMNPIPGRGFWNRGLVPVRLGADRWGGSAEDSGAAGAAASGEVAAEDGGDPDAGLDWNARGLRLTIRTRGEDRTMPQNDGTGPPQGGGRGRGRMGGPFAAGPGGNCVCPKCGHKVSHGAGQPCNQKACPKCGTAMTRG